MAPNIPSVDLPRGGDQRHRHGNGRRRDHALDQREGAQLRLRHRGARRHGVPADPELLRIHNESGLTTPDGMPLVWCARCVGARHRSMTALTDSGIGDGPRGDDRLFIVGTT